MSFFKQQKTADTPPKKEAKPNVVEAFVMSDGSYCVNDQSLITQVSSKATTPEDEKEFSEHITGFVDMAAAQFFMRQEEGVTQ